LNQTRKQLSTVGHAGVLRQSVASDPYETTQTYRYTGRGAIKLPPLSLVCDRVLPTYTRVNHCDTQDRCGVRTSTEAFTASRRGNALEIGKALDTTCAAAGSARAKKKNDTNDIKMQQPPITASDYAGDMVRNTTISPRSQHDQSAFSARHFVSSITTIGTSSVALHPTVMILPFASRNEGSVYQLVCRCHV